VSVVRVYDANVKLEGLQTETAFLDNNYIDCDNITIVKINMSYGVVKGGTARNTFHKNSKKRFTIIRKNRPRVVGVYIETQMSPLVGINI
jgi:hypothetical protein